MNFGRSERRRHDELDINLIPLIDVLLVILIFLAATTSFTRRTQLEVELPKADSTALTAQQVVIAVSSDGRYALGGKLVDGSSVQTIAAALAASVRGQNEPVLLINADARASHQSVIDVMRAAGLAGIKRVNFAAQSAP